MRVFVTALLLLASCLANAAPAVATAATSDTKTTATQPHQGEWVQAQWDVMGTRATLEFWLETPTSPHVPDSPSATKNASTQPIVLAIKHEFERLNQLLSPWIEDSELAQVNANAANHAVPISAEFFALLQRSRWYFEKTDGAFDITFASAGHLYDYREAKQPNAQTLENVQHGIGLQRVIFNSGKSGENNNSVSFSDAATRIDLGGIAKGYAIDQAVKILKDHAVQHAYIGLGGDSYVLGDRHGRDWQVGIRHPRNENAVALTLPVADIAISTSGDYERFFILSGERIHHIINPQTGRSSSSLVSATVLAEKGIDADALSTSIFVMGAEKGLEMINKLDGVSAILIDPTGNVRYSDDLMSPESL